MCWAKWIITPMTTIRLVARISLATTPSWEWISTSFFHSSVPAFILARKPYPPITYTPNSTWANELRGGFTHYVLQILPSDIGFPYVINTGLTNPSLKGIPDVRIDGFTQLGAFHNFPKIVGPDKVYDFIDQVSYLRGKHALKFGGEIRRDLVHQATFRAGRGRVRFQGDRAFAPPVPGGPGGSTPLEDFLAGDPNQATFLAGDPTRNLSQWLYAGFIQDDWRITRKLTLNLGLRYEFQAVPTEDHNLL